MDTHRSVAEDRSLLEPVLYDVQATLASLLDLADEQYAAMVASDIPQLERITRQQERLASRLERAERKRLDYLGDEPLQSALAHLPVEQAERLAGCSQSIAESVRRLQPRHARNAQLLERSAELAGQTVSFLQRLVSPPSPSYGARGHRAPDQSLLLDSRA